MSKLKLNHLKILIETEIGTFGTEFSLKDGLNIIRAKNSRGKSSCFHAMLYAMGIEEILGGRNSETMKPVLKSELVYEGKQYHVLESRVLLEVENNKNETITLTRWIKSNSKDDRLIRVQFGPALSSNEKFETADYYVHLAGSAQNESGFHKFFENFLGLALPLVPTFEGKERTLYIQTLFPLFFVEQTKGWSSFYSTPSLNFGIRDISKRAVEFLLDLDVMNSSKLREHLKIRKTIINQSWSSLMKDIAATATRANAIVTDFPNKVELSYELNVVVPNENGEKVSIEDRIYEIEKRLERTRVEPTSIKNALPDIDDEEKKLTDIIIHLQNEINTARRDLALERKDLHILKENLSNLQEDLKKNKEAERLYKLGSDLMLNLAKHQCPTCNQALNDTLLAQDIELTPMSLEENICYINGQIKTVEYGISQSKLIINRKSLYLRTISKTLDENRKNLRILKQEANEDPRMPSQYELEKIVDMKLEARTLRETNEKFDEYKVKIKEVQADWRKYQEDLLALPEEYFSELDKRKLNNFQDVFKQNLNTFDFSSVSLDEIEISFDKYTPLIEGVDVRYDTSASDYVRLIWAYLIALLQTSNLYRGNHLGFLVFDEPGQHQMSTESQKHLFCKLNEASGQSIVASSLNYLELEELTSGMDVHIVDLGNEKIIKPIE